MCSPFPVLSFQPGATGATGETPREMAGKEIDLPFLSISVVKPELDV